VANEDIKLKEAMAKIAALEAVNADLKAKSDAAAKARYRCQVSEKKAVSFYGLGRFPVTLYDEQWDDLETQMPMIRAFRLEARKAGKLQTEAEKAVAKAVAKEKAKEAAKASKAAPEAPEHMTLQGS
jgi:hypothetical protein